MLLLGLCFLLLVQLSSQKALDDYVNRPDPTYRYDKISESVDAESGTRILAYNLTSLKWKNESVSTATIWWHHLTIMVPTTVRYPNHAMLFIGFGGQLDIDPPLPDTDPLVGYMLQSAIDLGIVSAYLGQIPNQPVVFKDDPLQEARNEDDIIGYTWKKFLVDSNATDPEILLPFPMTKAAVRAMDAVQSIVTNEAPGSGFNPQKYFLLGPSKRGWTTWLAAAVDQRVFAIAPQVFSILNTMTNLHQHFRALGGWTWAFRPYWRNNITIFIDHPNGAAMASHIDPLEYKERLTMPKLLVSSTGDEFFLNQDSHVWWNQMTKPMYSMMLDNAGHDMFPHYERIFENIKAFFRSSVASSKTPELSWTFSQTSTGAKIRFESDTSPSQVTSYYADTDPNAPNNGQAAKRRDWRTLQLTADGETDLVNITWESGPVNDLGNNIFEVEYPKPADGWKAFYIEAKFPGPEGENFTFCSEVNIAPNTFPFPDCTGIGCHGQLV